VRLYQDTGRAAAAGRSDFAGLARLLAELLRQPPSQGGLRNALQHLWGHVASLPPAPEENPGAWPLRRLLEETQRRAMLRREPYLTASTALGELMQWTEPPEFA